MKRASVPPVAELPASELKDNSESNSVDARYLSEWDDNVIRFEAKDIGSKSSRVEKIDLNTVYLCSVGENGIYQRQLVPLTDFPQFILAIKVVVRRVLWERTTGIKTEVTTAVNHCLRFFSFLLGNGIYSLLNVDRQTCDLYKYRILHFGWWKANSYNMELRRAIRTIRANKELQLQVTGKSRHNTFFTLSAKELEKVVGLPIPSQLIPRWFYRLFQRIIGDNRPLLVNDATAIAPSHGSCQLVFGAINKLYYGMDGFDSLPFRPYPRPANIADDFFGRPSSNDGRTDNLELSTVVKIIDQSLRWLYDYGPSLITMLEKMRTNLEEFAMTARIGSDVYYRFLNSLCEDVFREFQSIHKLPLDGILRPVFGETSIRNLVATYQVSMFFNIDACTARRRNELIGHNKDYGLYFGCLHKVSEDSDEYRYDVYIEKTLFNYAEYWAPNIAAKSIQALEALSQVFRPLFFERYEYVNDVEAARERKLFSSVNFTYVGFLQNRLLGFDLPEKCKLFFKLAGVNSKEIFGRNRNVFRRFYCLVYVNRYDNPVLAALRNHLDHSSVYGTAIYGLDPHGRHPKKKAAETLKRLEKDELDFGRTLSQVRDEHHADIVARLLRGENIGGLHARLLIKLMARLSANAKFIASPTSVKADLVTETMRRRGFEVNEKDNGICMAGKARHTARKANCFDGSTVHPERAGPKICSGCINLLTSEGYRQHMRSERDALLQQSQDMSLSREHRQSLRQDALDIEAYLEADEKLAAGNQQMVIRLVQQWSDLKGEKK
ncbi:hypothetical protein [Paraburkholderia sp. J63]|uniref:hypothetical protein n=1 Tax=Paraburkholderia sp. J63 TaxID=2805434 RepID=UPI002ABD829F|nr:hypothetical protein [Paraburkholderia sp. J63]